jgi:hypothetical protein
MDVTAIQLSAEDEELLRREGYRLIQALDGHGGGDSAPMRERGWITIEPYETQEKWGKVSMIKMHITDMGRAALTAFNASRPNCGMRCWPSRHISKGAGGVTRCEACGGHFPDESKPPVLTCRKCKKVVDRLTGLFVPHTCLECADKERARQRDSGDVCSMCRQPRFDCCC